MARQGGLPLVTVVTPVLNQAATIGDTIESVLEQDYPHLEHLVIDGGSTDGTLAVLAEKKARYGRRLRWRSGPDRGQAHALNLGFQMARGEIVGWQNGDDYYLPGAIRTLAGALLADPGLAVAYTGVRRIDEGGRRLDPWAVEPFSYARLLLHCMIANQAALARRRVLLQYQLPEDTPAMDYWLWLQVGLHHRLRYVPGEGGVFRLAPWTPSGSSHYLFARDSVRFLDEVLADPAFPAELRPIAPRLVKFKLAVAAPMLAYRGQFRQAWAMTRRWASLRPGAGEWAYFLLRFLVGKHTRRVRYLVSRVPVLKQILAKPRIGMPDALAAGGT